MINKKIVITAGIIIAILLLGASIFSYLYTNSPRYISEKAITSTEDNANKYLTDNFIAEIEKSSSSNREFLDENVKDYSVTKNIRSVKNTNIDNNTVNSIIILRATTKNTKTGFTVTTEDTYEATLLKFENSWKIDSYKLVNSTTL